MVFQDLPIGAEFRISGIPDTLKKISHTHSLTAAGRRMFVHRLEEVSVLNGAKSST